MSTHFSAVDLKTLLETLKKSESPVDGIDSLISCLSQREVNSMNDASGSEIPISADVFPIVSASPVSQAPAVSTTHAPSVNVSPTPPSSVSYDPTMSAPNATPTVSTVPVSSVISGSTIGNTIRNSTASIYVPPAMVYPTTSEVIIGYNLRI